MRVASLPGIAANVVSILSSDVMNRATTFVLYALVARHLGAHEFGQLALALTLFYTFQVLAAAGLKTLITREVAKDRALTARYLVNGSLVAFASSSLAVGALLLFVFLMDYAPDTAAVIVLLALGLLPYALSAVFDAIFQAWERMHYIAFASLPVNVARIGLAYLALQQGFGLYHLIVMLMASYAVVVGIEWWLVRRVLDGPLPRPEPRFSTELVRSTTTFLGIDVLIAVSASLNVIVLSKLASETDVGLYSAAVQVLVPMGLLLQSVALGIFPLMCKQLDPGFVGMKRIAEQAIVLLMAVVLPVTVGAFMLADAALLLLYGNEDFLPAADLLRIAVWSLVPLALTTILGHVLMAAGRERLTLGLVAAHLVGNLVLGLLLIGQLGAVGAVVVVLLDRVIGLGGHYVLVSRLIGRVGLATLAWRPIVASAVMGAWLAVVRSEGLIVAAVTGGVVYASVLLILTVWALGGPRHVRARYLQRWSG